MIQTKYMSALRFEMNKTALDSPIKPRKRAAQTDLVGSELDELVENVEARLFCQYL